MVSRSTLIGTRIGMALPSHGLKLPTALCSHAITIAGYILISKTLGRNRHATRQARARWNMGEAFFYGQWKEGLGAFGMLDKTRPRSGLCFESAGYTAYRLPPGFHMVFPGDVGGGIGAVLPQKFLHLLRRLSIWWSRDNNGG
ncbi:hypothetical protein BOTBODRAFT_587391 [Botryobasidium botryosum FD-172 SS1]|uniref:Uncharacterized protein n=1 Tax=Botryobasidium botryosum (strain FD-172 SS1) TaxID=930990 RepID=A0A067M7Y3_BOTB1|nr:hypothetical protein BOTBODRAFT_587391 [Botryobasidium botryosum FD-172 SS1]